MEFGEFAIGAEFFCSVKRWRCTDIGTRTRTIVAVALDHPEDPSWHNGPPYAMAEMVFDEEDQIACEPIDESGPLGDRA